MSSIAGQLAVVTGASRGIGRAIATALADEGATVVMVARTADALEEAARSIGGRAVPVRCDVGSLASMEAELARVRERYGSARILVNNAGAFQLSRLDRTRVADFARMLDVNLVGPFAVLRQLLPDMLERRDGHVVTIGSIADRVAYPENGAYAASKFGLRALHEVLRSELVGTGVRSTLVSPGPVDTALWNEIGPDDRPGFTPRNRMLKDQRVAAAVLFALKQPPDVNVDELRLSRA